MSFNNQNNFDNDDVVNSGARRGADETMGRSGDVSSGYDQQRGGRDQFDQQRSGRDQLSSQGAGGNQGFDDSNMGSTVGTNTGMGAGGNSEFDNDYSMQGSRGGRGMSDTTGTGGYGGDNDFESTGRSGGIGAGAGGAGYGDNTGTTGYGTGAGTGAEKTGGRPGVGDKIKGTMEATIGKVTKNQDKVERGQERKTGGDTNF